MENVNIWKWLYGNFEKGFACWENFENHYPKKLKRPKSNEQYAKSNEQRANGNEQQAKGSALRYTPPHMFHWGPV